jgi:hypothetical protein
MSLSAGKRQPAPRSTTSQPHDSAYFTTPRKQAAAVRRVLNSILFVPITALALVSKARASISTVLSTATEGARYAKLLFFGCSCLPMARVAAAILTAWNAVWTGMWSVVYLAPSSSR